MKRKSLIFVILILTIILGGCKKDNTGQIVNGYTQIGELKLEQLQMPEVGEEIAVITTNMGVMKLRLFPDVAPMAVENFTTLAKEGFYDGIKITRIILDNLIQSGKHKDYGKGKSIFGDFFEDEFDENYVHITGAVGLTKFGGSSRHGSTFYIISQGGLKQDYIEMMRQMDEGGQSKDRIDAYEVLGGIPRLDGNYTIFAQVFYGIDTLMEINKVEMDPLNDAPIKDVVIETIEIVPFEGK
ncbi:peptidylprolyl isomerase [Tissierella pigra]|uniref:Peptidyl-prolyl cis-trans isomerase n=1 Tax=Tissierella pigra TaxID=2607614 RepID=A0A6N7Y1X6_9FIRM|nr:peptidylprolyl isomerase [Tissierella pigra]MSU02745.1 peptidylprolyl isomerase [Tissierella pigra]